MGIASTADFVPALEPRNYPYLGRLSSSGMIVLFTGKNVGTVVHPGNGGCTMGLVSGSWEEQRFSAYSGTVHLKNA